MTTYEPGSTYKVVTFSAALSAGLIYPHMVFRNLPWKIRVGDKFIHDDVWRRPVSYDATQILQKSSNVGTDTIAQIVGKPLLMHWIRKYGFGRPTGLDFPGESPGIVLPGRSWTASSIGTIPIGQGIGVTAMQMASMYQAIANGGVMVPPRLVQAIGGRQIKPSAGRRVLTPEVDRELVDMLGTVVQDGGTGFNGLDLRLHRGRQDGHRAEARNGGYSTSDYDASFVGFFPADDPQVEIMIVVDSPRTSHFGGVVAAPAFEQIGTWYANYLGISPDRPVDRSVTRFPRGCSSGDADRGRSGRVPSAGRLTLRSPRSPTAPMRSCPVRCTCACPGFTADGHDFAAEAVRRGAAALVVERDLPLDVPQLLVESSRRAMAAGRRRLLRPSQRPSSTWSASPARTARRRRPS